MNEIVLAAPHPTLSRIDVIARNELTDEVMVMSGVPAVVPVQPALPDGMGWSAVAAIWVVSLARALETQG